MKIQFNWLSSGEKVDKVIETSELNQYEKCEAENRFFIAIVGGRLNV